MSDSRTQSVCGERFNKHVNMVCNLEKGHSHMHHFEPVSEPASTGEPPPTCIKCGGNLVASPTVHCPKCASTNFLVEAARPSGPSAPQTSAEHCRHCGQLEVAHFGIPRYCYPYKHPDWKEDLVFTFAQPVSGDAPPQLSVKCHTCESLLAYERKGEQIEIYHNCPGRTMEAAPSPTPSVSTLKREPCFRGCTLTKDRKLCADKSGLMINYCGCDCHDPAAPSVAGTQPTPWSDDRAAEAIIAICGTFVPGGWEHPGDECVRLIRECIDETRPGASQGTPQGAQPLRKGQNDAS